MAFCYPASLCEVEVGRKSVDSPSDIRRPKKDGGKDAGIRTIESLAAKE